MKSIASWSLPLFLVVVAPAVQAFECSVMTFNVRLGTAKDGPNAWEHRRDLLVDTIKKAEPDIIGTQECLDFQAAYMVSALPEYRWIGLGRQADGTGEMTAVLYRKDLLLPVAVSHHWLSETPEVPGSKSWDSSLPRIATRIKFIHIESGKPLVAMNTHFDHKGAEARRESARLLARMARAETLPMVVMGDFNALGGASAPWEALTDGGLLDAWDVATETAGPANTWNGFGVEPITEDRRIDWILVSAGIEVRHCAIMDDQREDRYPSDHFPVFARLTVGKP